MYLPTYLKSNPACHRLHEVKSFYPDLGYEMSGKNMAACLSKTCFFTRRQNMQEHDLTRPRSIPASFSICAQWIGRPDPNPAFSPLPALVGFWEPWNGCAFQQHCIRIRHAIPFSSLISAKWAESKQEEKEQKPPLQLEIRAQQANGQFGHMSISQQRCLCQI